ncbi:MAG: serine/threonine protein kinase [Chloroflexi bacterium]|nr:serine/threonine protein kinase [Chloroflexota bacterium]
MPLELEHGIGPYRVVSQLGRGGMATVYKAYQPALDRHVALKVLNADLQANPDFVTRFKREAKIIAKLDHPNIIPVYDIELFDGVLCLVMRYIEGISLREALNRIKKPIAMPAILQIMRPITDALAYAHQKSVLHRDVKPSNIMLGNDGNVYLMDFGLAVTTTESEMNLSKGLVLGTPYYVSPEQVKGESLDQRTDIYSLGIVLFELLTGKLPFTGDTYDIVVYHQIFSLPPAPSSLNPGITPGVEQVVLRALAKEKSDRFFNAAEMRQALESAGQGNGKMLKPFPVAEANRPLAPVLEDQLTQSHPPVVPARQRWSASGYLLVLAIIVLVVEVMLLVPTIRTALRDALSAFETSSDQGGDAARIIIGTVSAYIATLSSQIILKRLRRRLTGVAFALAIAFGITLIIALALAFLVLLLLKVL